MGSIRYLNPAGVSRPNGPYQHASTFAGWLFIAGQIPVYPDDPDRPIPEGIESQAELVFGNIRAILDDAGYGFSDIVHVRNFLRDLSNDMPGFNRVYERQFEPECLPPRTTVGVNELAKGALVEVDLIAYKPPGA